MAEDKPTAKPPESMDKPTSVDDVSDEHSSRGWLARLRRTAVGAAFITLIIAAFWLGTRCESSQTDLSQRTQVDGETIEHWTCSMHPQIQQPEPGSCPICGMDLIPVHRDTEKARPKKREARPPKYACAMMCVPPLDLPGKCPICGMDMVVVAEEEDDEEEPDTVRPENLLGEIRLSGRAQRLAQLEVAPVERRMVDVEIRTVGMVDFDETRLRTISARVPGRLDRLYVDYTGMQVRQGDHLAQLYSPELLAAQAELIQALQAHRNLPPAASPDIRRMREESLRAARQKLLLWGVTPDQVAAIEERGATSDHLTLYAPIGGIVTEKRLVEGAYVEEGTEIFKIADLSHVWVMLDAYEVDLSWLRYGQDVEFTTETYGGEKFHGRIAFIDPVINARTRTAKVRVNVSNPDGRLKPEMFVRALVKASITADNRVVSLKLEGAWMCPMHPEVVTESPGECPQCGMSLATAESLGYAPESHEDHADIVLPLVIPSSAPLITGKRAVVYVAHPERPGRFEGREVVLGPRAGDYYVVREGLSGSEQVVVQGAIYIDSAVQILGRPSMMHPDTDVPAPPPGHDHNGLHEHTREKEPAHAQAPDRLSLSEDALSLFDPLFTAYLTVQHALAHDQFDRSREAIKEFVNAATAFDVSRLPERVQEEGRSLRTDLTQKGEAVASAKDIETARTAFEHLSNSMISAAKRWGAGSRDRLLIYHCPMAFDDRGASWLQGKVGVENPYFGAAMFRCGFLEETVKRQNFETFERQNKELEHRHD